MDSLIVYSTNWEVLYTFGKDYTPEYLKSITTLGYTLEDSLRGELHSFEQNWLYFKSFSINSVILVSIKPLDNSNRPAMESILSDSTSLCYQALCFLIGMNELTSRHSSEIQITIIELQHCKHLILSCMYDKYLPLSLKSSIPSKVLQNLNELLSSYNVELWCMYYEDSKLVCSEMWNGLEHSTQMFLYKMRYSGFMRDLPVFISDSPTRYISIQLNHKYTLSLLINPEFDAFQFCNALIHKLNIFDSLKSLELSMKDGISSLPSEVLTFIAYHNTRLVSKLYKQDSKDYQILSSHIKSIEVFIRDGIYHGRLKNMLVFCISNEEIVIQIGFEKNTSLKTAKRITIEIFNYFQENF